MHHYGMSGHRNDADDDVAFYEEMRDAADVTRMPSGELVAKLLDGMVSGDARAAPGEPSERTATSTTSPTTPSSRSWASPTAPVCAGVIAPPCPGSWASTSGASTSRRSGRSRPRCRAIAELVLEAMLADPIAAQLSYENVVAMTDEMLAATARWLPQFA